MEYIGKEDILYQLEFLIISDRNWVWLMQENSLFQTIGSSQNWPKSWKLGLENQQEPRGHCQGNSSKIVWLGHWLALLGVTPHSGPGWNSQQALQLPNQEAGLFARHPHAVGRKNSPKDTHGLIPETYKHVSSHGKRDFANVIKLNNLRKGEYPGLSSGPELRDSLKIEKRSHLWWEGDMTMQEASELCCLKPLGL